MLPRELKKAFSFQGSFEKLDQQLDAQKKRISTFFDPYGVSGRLYGRVKPHLDRFTMSPIVLTQDEIIQTPPELQALPTFEESYRGKYFQAVERAIHSLKIDDVSDIILTAGYSYLALTCISAYYCYYFRSKFKELKKTEQTIPN